MDFIDLCDSDDDETDTREATSNQRLDANTSSFRATLAATRAARRPRAISSASNSQEEVICLSDDDEENDKDPKDNGRNDTKKISAREKSWAAFQKMRREAAIENELSRLRDTDASMAASGDETTTSVKPAKTTKRKRKRTERRAERSRKPASASFLASLPVRTSNSQEETQFSDSSKGTTQPETDPFASFQAVEVYDEFRPSVDSAPNKEGQKSGSPIKSGATLNVAIEIDDDDGDDIVMEDQGDGKCDQRAKGENRQDSRHSEQECDKVPKDTVIPKDHSSVQERGSHKSLGEHQSNVGSAKSMQDVVDSENIPIGVNDDDNGEQVQMDSSIQTREIEGGSKTDKDKVETKVRESNDNVENEGDRLHDSTIANQKSEIVSESYHQQACEDVVKLNQSNIVDRSVEETISTTVGHNLAEGGATLEQQMTTESSLLLHKAQDEDAIDQTRDRVMNENVENARCKEESASEQPLQNVERSSGVDVTIGKAIMSMGSNVESGNNSREPTSGVATKGSKGAKQQETSSETILETSKTAVPDLDEEEDSTSRNRDINEIEEQPRDEKREDGLSEGASASAPIDIGDSDNDIEAEEEEEEDESEIEVVGVESTGPPSEDLSSLASDQMSNDAKSASSNQKRVAEDITPVDDDSVISVHSENPASSSQQPLEGSAVDVPIDILDDGDDAVNRTDLGASRLRDFCSQAKKNAQQQQSKNRTSNYSFPERRFIFHQSKQPKRPPPSARRPGASTWNYAWSCDAAMKEQERLFQASAARMRSQATARVTNNPSATRNMNHTIQFQTVEPKIAEKYPLHWQFPDFHARLGLPVGSSENVIKKQFRRLALLYHPDKSQEANTATKFHKITEAYRSLLN